MSARVLVVDASTEAAELLAKVLTRAGYTTHCTHSAEEALAALGTQAFDCLIVDKQLPQMMGEELMAAARARVASLAVVVMTSKAEPFTLGAERPHATLLKPFKSTAAIEEAVEEAMASSSAGKMSLTERLTAVVQDIAPRLKKRD